MGAAVAELLAARGAYVVVTARHREDSEPPTSLIQADLASPEGADFVAGEAIRILGGLDIVVHCAGASFSKPGGVLALVRPVAPGISRVQRAAQSATMIQRRPTRR